MRNVLSLFIFAALLSSPAFASEGDSVASILEELRENSEAASRSVSEDVVDTPADQPADQPAGDVDALFEEEPVASPDVESLLEKSREAFLGGDFIEAEQGFTKALQLDPESIMARSYLRTLMERDQRTAEIEGMDAVDAAWSTDLVLRSYALADGAGENLDLGETTETVDVQALFPQVDFPKGAQAIYQPKMQVLFVRNTTANLQELEAILDATGVLKDSGDVEQVEIESKFVEVSEGTLEELGFQWNFTDPETIKIGATDMEVIDGPGGLFANALRGSPSGSSPELPFNRPGDLGYGSESASGDWSSFRIEDTFNSRPDSLGVTYQGKNTSLDVLISALDQSSGSDVLSAPRVVTQSGEEAIIRVGERHYFPEVFEGDSSQATMLYISYEDFEEKLLGVEMSVTPEVDGDQIQLGLRPVITELVKWRNYQLAPADYIYNHRQSGIATQWSHEAVVASLPVFKKREIETEVIINDGGTIGMGGLISEKIEAFEDKVPVLGNLPLVGRLFRNEGERAVKRNLLMFVTAKKVAPSGRVNTTRSFE